VGFARLAKAKRRQGTVSATAESIVDGIRSISVKIRVVEIRDADYQAPDD
jgi:broad specificity polyphosphatase/5'/3'-nucleotidase SurE